MYLGLHETAAHRRAATRHLTVLHDAECGFCLATVRWLEARDRHGRLRFVALQEAPTSGRAMLRELARTRDLAAELHVVDERAGTVSSGAEAVLMVLAVLPGWGWLTRLGRPRPAMWVADRAYRLVARQRRHLRRLASGEGGVACATVPRDQAASGSKVTSISGL
jgi:predicted DCC family thiol-disulfide oxidoreductase YuxK